MLAIDDFPHHGEHHDNDAKMAEITLSLISVLFIVISFVAFGVILTRY